MNKLTPKPKLAFAAAFFASLLIIVSLLFSLLQLVVHNDGWLAGRYEAYGTAQEIGIPTEDITAAFMQLIYYMDGDVDTIQLTVHEFGAEVPMYNQREIMHMEDVRTLYQAWRTLRDWGVSAAVLLIFLCILLSEKREWPRTLAKGFLWASAFLGLVIAAFGVWVAVDFNGFWLNFHYLFFDNDLWLLSYATDRMIRICPQQLFYDIVVRFGILFIIAFGALLACAVLCLKKKKPAA